MRVGIMQPYIYPYIGYFQLIHAVDTFVFYDDVNFIKQGWINRNRILASGQEHLFTVPVVSISSFKKINETEVNQRLYAAWRKKFLRTVHQNYARSPFYDAVFAGLESVLTEDQASISELAKRSVSQVLDYLGVRRNVVWTSAGYNNSDLKAQDRVLDICEREGATTYINVPGGRDLYDVKTFSDRNIRLQFIQPQLVEYRQHRTGFLPWLSIIDVMFHNSPGSIVDSILPKYSFS